MLIPPGLKYDAKASAKADQNRTFIRVGRDLKTKGGVRHLSGATRLWDKPDPNVNQTIFVTHPSARLTGTRADVEDTLRRAGFSEQDIGSIMATAITRDNYQVGMAGAYNDEIAQHRQALDAKGEPAPVNWVAIRALALNLKEAIYRSKTGGETAVSPRRKPGAPTGPRDTSLRARYQNLPADKQLDVSHFDGTKGAHKEAIPARRTGGVSRSGKVSSDIYPRLVSNSYDGYRMALRAINGSGADDASVDGDQNVAAALNEVYAKLTALQAKPAPVAPAAVARATALSAPGRALSRTPTTRAVPTVASPGARVGTLGGTRLQPMPTARGLQQR